MLSSTHSAHAGADLSFGLFEEFLQLRKPMQWEGQRSAVSQVWNGLKQNGISGRLQSPSPLTSFQSVSDHRYFFCKE